ncbi:ABC transporter ATP-binding protein [Haloplanus rallus]|uniref:ABC transporter ATP-binding protein n=1 Tax=Haloplanus rallus TaxID=1816183 RepID=A0A6B9F8D3_9EURY|nr:ABC transporter ATP-binding protein [Haloplanus rallus]QGX95752.1 ABC transporter ATP-binding protein [Haloplanus rallus]
MDVPADDDPFEEQRERTANPMRRLFAEYGEERRGVFAVGVLASVLARVLDLLPPLLLGIAVDAIFLDEGPFGLPLVPDRWLPTDPERQFWLIVGIVLFSFLGGAALHWVRNWGWNRFAQHVQHAIRTDTYDAMQRLNMTFFADKQTGEMMSVLSNDVNRLERFLNDGLNAAFRLGVMVVGIAAILLWMNPQLAVVALLPVPLIAVFTYRFVNTIQPKYAEVRSTVGQVNSRLENNLGGIQVIKTSNTESYEAERVEEVSGDYFDANWDAIETRIKFFPGLRVLAGIGFALTFTIGGLWVFRGEGPWLFTGTLRPGEFVSFILYTQRFIWPMAQFGQIINMYQRAYASAARIFGLMDEDAGIDVATDATELVVDEGRVEYDDVTFGYEAEVILDGVSFEAGGGETVALVGPTGAGKSTALKLLLRMYDVDDGAVRVDGTDVRDVTLASLRSAIGYVSQETFLFYGTVRENITYGTFDASDEAVRAAAAAAEAHEFVTNLPDGYDTMVGERGVKLSGGQRQRLAIARAMLKDPEILILDEATSDVDTETEMLIQRSLDRLTADRTTFVIAHRLSTVKDADGIVVLDGGEVVEQGTHEELLAADGLYASLWGVQAGEIDDLPAEFVERATERGARADVDVDLDD